MLKSFNIPMFSYLHVSRATGITVHGGPQQETARSAASSSYAPLTASAAAQRNESACHTTTDIELPNEIWGEIASFSTHTDVLNLRATSTALRSQADTAVKTMTIADGASLRAFSDAESFAHLESLRVDVVDQASTDYFAHALAARPRPGLTLELMHGYANLRVTLARLGTVPLAALVLKSPNLDHQILCALRRFLAPITLVGRFDDHDFAALSCIPTLSNLLVLSHGFDETAAQHLSSHRSLHSIALPLTEHISPRCVDLLASVSSLRHWRLTEMVYAFCPLRVSVAEALAANGSLQKLVIRTHSKPISRASFHALSRSETLKKLEISTCPGLENLGNLATLEHLHLNNWCRDSPPISQQAAASIAALVNLRSLCILGAQFAQDALITLLTVSPADKLYLKSVPLNDEHFTALMHNAYLRDLTLVDISLTPEQVATLLAHPTLVSLRIGADHYHLRPKSRNIA